MEILFKHFWILLLFGAVFNAFTLKKKTAKYILEKPERRSGYDSIFKNYLIFGTIPWLIIGIGNLTGATSSVFEYFQPAKMNPIVLLFHFSIVVIWILAIRFIFFNDGAKFLEDHPGVVVINSFGNVNENPTAKTIKLLTGIMIIVGIIGMTIMWFSVFPFPKF